jgi:hypothetical protein
MEKYMLALDQGLALEIPCRELGLDPLSVTKCGVGSEILAGRLRPKGEGDA